ncbi:MAG: hypothetical protein WCG47_28295 [Dermatophilaceae bacterium]
MPGRRTGVVRRGRAVLGRRTRYAVTPVDGPPAERARVIHADLHRPGRRGMPTRRDREALSYFGVDPDATVADLEAIVERYPIFRVDSRLR